MKGFDHIIEAATKTVSEQKIERRQFAPYLNWGITVQMVSDQSPLLRHHE